MFLVYFAVCLDYLMFLLNGNFHNIWWLIRFFVKSIFKCNITIWISCFRYAWILLIVFQLLMTNVSLLGHLCGILSGFACQFLCLLNTCSLLLYLIFWGIKWELQCVVFTMQILMACSTSWCLEHRSILLSRPHLGL